MEEETLRNELKRPVSGGDLWRHLDKPTAGYDGAKEDPPDRPKVWKIDRAQRFHSSRVVATVTCNDEPRGMLNLDSEEELQWWKGLLAGRYIQP